MSYTLIDAVEKNKKHPDTFGLPGDTSWVRPGDFVKIGVTFVGKVLTGERFWVRVTSRVDDHFFGTINNDLRCTNEHGLKDTDTIEFYARNILECLHEQQSANDEGIRDHLTFTKTLEGASDGFNAD